MVSVAIVMVFAFTQALWAAPKLEPSNAKGGDCVACHGMDRVLPENHVDTKTMNWNACKACHNKNSMSLAGKLTGSHYHQLAGVNCKKCHGETETPEALAMDQCIACHGSTSELAERTKDVKPANPHNSPHYGPDLDCTLCHHQHTKSEVYCAKCHKFNLTAP